MTNWRGVKMSMAGVVVLSVVALGSVVARAQSTTPVKYLFATVDSVFQQSNGVGLTGILQGDSTPTSLFVDLGLSSDAATTACQRAAMLVMLRPGQFILQVFDSKLVGAPMRCTLVKAQP